MTSHGSHQQKLDERHRFAFWLNHRESVARKDWRSRISDHIAYGLLVYTGLQIFVTMKQLKELSHSLLPYFALIVLVAAIIPAARALEGRWLNLDDDAAHDPSLAPQFRLHRLIIWATAIGLPFVLAGLARCVALTTG